MSTTELEHTVRDLQTADSYSPKLYDRRTDQIAWVATGEVEGNAFASTGQMRSRAMDRTIKQLVKDGVIR